MKISVIIPIYKVERYLRQCVDSVLNQTYRDLEVILVDDGSPDGCPQICNEYAERDSRVIAIHQENTGPSGARQAGIYRASGEYITYLDGDDWIDHETIESCLQAMHDTRPDCIIYSYVREYPEKSIIAHVLEGNDTIEGANGGIRIHRRLFGLIGEELRHPERLESLGSCCMKLYRQDIARKGRYFDTKEVGSSEDTLFNIYALRACTSVLYIDRPFYHYRKAGDSITSTYRPKLIQQWQRLFEIMEDFIRENNLDQSYTDAMNARIALSVLGIGMNELSGSDSFVKRVSRVKEYLRLPRYQSAVRTVAASVMPLPWRVLMTLAKYKMAYLVCLELLAIDKLRRKH